MLSTTLPLSCKHKLCTAVVGIAAMPLGAGGADGRSPDTGMSTMPSSLLLMAPLPPSSQQLSRCVGSDAASLYPAAAGLECCAQPWHNQTLLSDIVVKSWHPELGQHQHSSVSYGFVCNLRDWLPHLNHVCTRGITLAVQPLYHQSFMLVLYYVPCRVC
jgi:hypothetical protein